MIKMVITYSLSDIDTVARTVLAKTKSKTLLFYGEMGTGKTTLIKSLVKALGAEDTASSPTFSLVNEYDASGNVIFHFDFYRIKHETEALDMGIEDYLNSPAWKFIEWPQKIEKFLDNDAHRIEISVEGKSSRMLKFS